MKLANSEGITAGKKICVEGRPSCIPGETVQLVESSFLLDSVSRQAPGKRDIVTGRVHGKKQQIQKRHLLWSLEEIFALFKKKHSSVKIGFSSFPLCTPRMTCYQDNNHTKHACVHIMRTFACCVTAYLRASLISQLIQISLLIVLCAALIPSFACWASVINGHSGLRLCLRKI